MGEDKLGELKLMTDWRCRPIEVADENWRECGQTHDFPNRTKMADDAGAAAALVLSLNFKKTRQRKFGTVFDNEQVVIVWLNR